MKQFGKILKFELKGYMKNKAFVGVTVFLVVAIAVAMFLPNIISAFNSDDEPAVTPTALPRFAMVIIPGQQRTATCRITAAAVI